MKIGRPAANAIRKVVDEALHAGQVYLRDVAAASGVKTELVVKVGAKGSPLKTFTALVDMQHADDENAFLDVIVYINGSDTPLEEATRLELHRHILHYLITTRGWPLTAETIAEDELSFTIPCLPRPPKNPA